MSNGLSPKRSAVFITFMFGACVGAGEPTDDTGAGAGNRVPSIEAAVISPEPAFAADTLTCAAQGFSDADGDADQSGFSWMVGEVQVGTGDSLVGAFGKGDMVRCVITPFDGIEEGQPVEASVTILNSLPSVASVAIDPPEPGRGDTLGCTYAGFADADGDVDQSTVSWTVNGVGAGTGPSLAGVFAREDTVACVVTPGDGEATGEPVSATVTVGNTPPTLTTVTLVSDLGTALSPVTAVPEGFADVDGDAPEYRYAWTVDGRAVTETGPSLSTGLSGGAVIVVTVTPFDGIDEGEPVTSDPLTLQPLGEVYPAPTGRESDLWEVEVQIDGTWRDAGAMQYARMSQDPNYHGQGYAHVDDTGPTGGGSPRVHWATVGVADDAVLPVRIRRLGGGLTSAEVLPTRFGVVPDVDLGASEITFSIRQGDKLYIATNDQDFDTLFLFANPAEELPEPASHVYTFDPGEQTIGVDWSPPPGVDTVVIPGGAWVIGSIDVTVSPSATVRVLGNGVLSGEFDTYENVKFYDNDPARPRPYAEKIDSILVHTDHQVTVSHAIEVEGITVLASPFYAFLLGSSATKTFSHVSMLAPWTYNTDAFNAKSNTTVTDCFVYNNDDTVHAEYVLDGPIATYGNVLAGRNAFLVGYGYFRGNKQYEAVMEDLELILQENRVPFRARLDARPNATPGSFDPAVDVVVENQVYRDILIHGDVDRLFYLGIEHTPWGYGGSDTSGPVYGNVRDLVFENIEVRGVQQRRSVIFGVDADNQMGTVDEPIVIRDLVIDGDPVTEANKDTYFDIGPFATVVFETTR